VAFAALPVPHSSACEADAVDLTRRSLLLTTAVGLTACTDRPAPKPAPVDPDIALLAAAVLREQTLLAAYQTAHGIAPSLITDVTTHLARLSALPIPQPTASPVIRAVPPRVLARATATAHAKAVPLASRTLAPVLASLAASAASHAVAL
jgi:hypothetical protein